MAFVAGGKYLRCDGTNVEFVDTEDEYTKFTLEDTDGGKLIKSFGFYSSGDSLMPQYLEFYKGYLTCYSISETSNIAIYTFVIQADVEGAQGVVTDY